MPPPIVEDAILLFVDMQAALPFIILALAALAIAGNTFLVFVIVLGVYGWETFARLMRGAVLSASGSAYVLAAKAIGTRPLRIYTRQILPNVAGLLIVQISLNFPATILLESGLSFVGLGIQPPSTSLGLMIGEGRDLLFVAPWVALAPGLTIFVTCLAASFLGDHMADRLNVTLR